MKVIIIYIIVLLIGFLQGNKKWALFVYAFVVLNPMRSLISQEEYLFTRIAPDNVANIMLLISFIFLQKNEFVKFKFLPDQLRTASVILLFFIFFINYYIRFKNMIILEKFDDPIRLFQVVRDFALIISFLLIAKSIHDPKIYSAVEKGIIMGSIFIGLSISYPDVFENIGLTTGFEVGERKSGFLALNPNSAGAYAAIIIGFCIARINTQKSKLNILYYLCILVMLAAIMNTGSRQALIATSLIIVYYIYNNFKNLSSKYLVISISLLILFTFFSYKYIGITMEQRMVEIVEDGGSLQSRMDHWLEYLTDIKRNPNYLLIGNINESPTIYDPHNYYLKLIWSAGIFVFIYFILLLFYLWKNAQSKGLFFAFDLRYVLIPLIITLFVNSYVLNYSLILIMFLSVGNPGLLSKRGIINSGRIYDTNLIVNTGLNNPNG